MTLREFPATLNTAAGHNATGADDQSRRHDSTGSASTRSVDTVRGPASTPSKRLPGAERKDSNVSPRTAASRPQQHQTRSNPGLRDEPTESGNMNPASGHDPSTSRRAATKGWIHHPGDRPVGMVTSVFEGTLYGDSAESLGHVPPSWVPPAGATFPDDDRRPSAASASTFSSGGSKTSSHYPPKRGTFLGDDYAGLQDGGRQTSLSGSLQNLVGSAHGNSRHRNNSTNDDLQRSGSPSPTSSRPRTPVNARNNDIAPWAPPEVRERQGSDDVSERSGRPFGSHHLHLPGHRYHGSSEDKSKPGHAPPKRSTSREPLQMPDDPMASSGSSKVNLPSRAKSPTPSSKSGKSQTGIQRSSTGGKQKRSLFDRFTGRHKNDKNISDHVPSSSVASSATVPSGSVTKKDATKSTAKLAKNKGDRSTSSTSKRLTFKGRKEQTEARQFKDPNALDSHEESPALWQLDTNLSKMEGIVDHRQPLSPSAGVDPIFNGRSGEPQLNKPPTIENEGWDAPESWAVKRVPDESLGRVKLRDGDGSVARDEHPGPLYFLRIFHADRTFAVVSAGLNTTASELIGVMAKKTFLHGELDKYQIIMRKHNTSRRLDAGERPLLLQKQLLEMAGYRENDHLENLGREDHGYLCRFTFLPAKMGGYASLERDPGFNKMQRFNHIDLSGRNLVTIPITLYQKATEIITLNLSRNLKLDIPKDFIQSCTQLREIKYTSNEAWHVPHSLSLASRLTMLDISNNRLEELAHADVHRLSGLVSLKLSNNKLSSVPDYFSRYSALRSLNLSSNSLSEFPNALRKLSTLVNLDISFNQISSLGNLGSLVNLERLWATNNRLSGPFDQSLRELVVLKEIDARFNAIVNIDVVSQLPNLEMLMLGHNSISQFEGSFPKLRVLFLNHNPVTNFDLTAPVPTLSVLNLASAKLARLPEALFSRMSGLTKLTISKNHFVSLDPQFGSLSKLEYLSIAKNELSRLPAEIGRLQELRYLDVRENNLGIIPGAIWHAKRLETLNLSSNVLSDFPKPNPPPPSSQDSASTPTQHAINAGSTTDFEELGRLEDFQMRRPSQASATTGVTSSPGTRKGSCVSHNSGKPSTIPRTSTTTSLGTIPPASRKDSTMSGRLGGTFAASLKHLFLADNRLEDDVFNELVLLPELRILNIGYNQLYDIPPRTIKRWPQLTELYLSGNDLTSLPSEDLEEGSSLKVLHINNNKFQTLPAELGKVHKLAILDVGSNQLKYNVSNWPYDWNWNWNHQLRYLNLSGNKRLEIKPSPQALNGRDDRDLTNFTSLANLRILGLMDVTLTIPSVPDHGPDRRVRTAGSIIGDTVPYGMADTLGRNEHLSTLDMVVPKFQGQDHEALVGLFDGQSLSSGGSRVAKYLHEKFKHVFIDELDKLRHDENPTDALRRTYLGLNKELATTATQAIDARDHPSSALVQLGCVAGPELANDDLNSGSVATVMYLRDMELYVSNVGDAQALLIQSEGNHRVMTRKHDPAETKERARIREAGGFVSRQGKLNDQLEVSRAFGYVHLTPCVIAAPHVVKLDIKDSDEMILLASRELWDYLTPDFAVDVARQERGDLMRAAQKLRDLAIAFGATGKIMVMMIGVSDLRKREKARFRTHSMGMGPTGSPDDYFTTVRKAKRGRDAVGDSKLARLDQEVDAPTGEVSLVFTDIKNSTILWETYPEAMQSAIRLHNEVMRRHLRIIGGYEVKTEGDAFMVAFPTVTSALLWAFTIQQALLEVHWPQEILNSVHGEEITDGDGNVIFRGLSVRMGIHWGRPVWEIDPVTKRMDYFGPMVNRAARIEGVADGGQICVSADFIQEVQRMLETHFETDPQTGSTGSEDTLTDDPLSPVIRRELQSLCTQGFEVKDLGQRTLKGLENAESIYLMYPHALSSRLALQEQKEEAKSRANQEPSAEGRKSRNSTLTIDTENVWDLWKVSLRLEMLCSTLEKTTPGSLKPPETALLEWIKQRGGEVTDRFLVNFVEHQISRIEACVSTLVVRNMMRPFKEGMLESACPMSEILGELTAQLAELQTFREQANIAIAPS